MLKKIIITTCLALSTNTMATTVDLYGDNPSHAAQVLRKYSQEVSQLIDTFNKEIAFADKEDKVKFAKLVEQKKNLINKIKNSEGYAFVDLQTVYYPDDKQGYTTIEVVRKDEKERLYYVHPKLTTKATVPVKHDLITKRLEFNQLEMKLLQANKLDPSDMSCPVYHCISGFNHPQLKPYLAVFNRGVAKHKELIINTLNSDVNPERRAAAAFLIGHFKDPQEIIKTLMPHIKDKDEGVRNDVMRVIAQTMAKAHITDIDVARVLPLINSPFTTDRNKALYILFSAIKSEKGKQLVLKQGRRNLVNLLRLKQPNNHEFAYLILKEISGKDYGEKNTAAWQSWADSLFV